MVLDLVMISTTRISCLPCIVVFLAINYYLFNRASLATVKKMKSYIPLTLNGNLGQRHRFLNNLVAEAYSNTSFSDVERLREQSPLDRLFKIDLASKHKQVGYIIQNLQHDDMLYVSRALKVTWLLDPEYQDIINPKHLEDVLFPEMITPAVSKMINWLYINFRDTGRRYQFYQHYKEKNIDLALKFLARCSNDDLLKEFPKILVNITPHYLKIFCEQCPEVSKIFFNTLSMENTVMTRHQNKIQAYLDSIKSTLKIDPDIYLDIVEKYHYKYIKKLSPIATKYIIRNRKNRFAAKQELYTAWFLHIPTLVEQLDEEECQELVITLARAKFLKDWFTYKEVEPLVKRLSLDRRAAFKKRIFVDKDVGDLVEDWPYPIPAEQYSEAPSHHAFDDPEVVLELGYDISCDSYKLRKGKFCKWGRLQNIQTKTELSRLFDEFRFIGFEGTYCKLSRRLGAAGSAESRRNMFLVLVSKTGGREASVTKLLHLMERHINEPAHLRAAIVRSLVKRACVWRLPDDAWASLLKFGHNLGLVGAPAESECHEGMHAVVLRCLLSHGEFPPTLRAAYLENFSDLSEYSLMSDEKARVTTGLTNLFLNAAEESEPEGAAQHLDRIIDVFKVFRIPIESRSPLVLAVINLAVSHADAARPILYKLYNARVARRELFLENLGFRHDDSSYVNALRHSPMILDPTEIIEKLAQDPTPLCIFIRKLAVYFPEHEGLASRLLHALRPMIEDQVSSKERRFKFNNELCRLFASLITGKDLLSYILQLDSTINDATNKRLSASLRAWSHLARPTLNFEEMEITKTGAKAITARAMICRNVEVPKYIYKLINWRSTIKTALLLAERNGTEASILAAASKLRPIAALNAALRYLRHYSDRAELVVWDLTKSLILNLDLKNREPLYRTLCLSVESIPSTFKAEYCITLYMALSKISINEAVHYLQQDIEILLPDIETEALEDVLLTMLLRNEEDVKSIVNPNFFVKYLLLCKTEEEQLRKLNTIGQRFLDRVIFLQNNDGRRYNFLKSIVKCLKYSKVFLDTRYVSCEPVFEKVIAWMQKNFPIEKFFNHYVELHLTMLYHRAIRQSVADESDIFLCPKRKMTEGVDIVGKKFGKLIARELNELVSKYFKSIVHLYEYSFEAYLKKYFLNGDSTNRLREAIINGILEEEVCVASRLVICLIKTDKYTSNTKRKEIINILKRKDMESQFFLYSELYTA